MTGSLTVGIDARKVRDFGIGRYLQGLLSGLAELGGDDRFILFLPTDPRRTIPESLDAKLPENRFVRVRCEEKLYSWKEQFAFLGSARKHGLDVLHFPHYVRTLRPGCPVVVSIHDAIHLSHPPSVLAHAYARLLMPWSGLTARLMTGTKAARDDISQRLGVVRANRFTVTPYGLDARFTPPEPSAVRRFRSERNLEHPFVLCIASHRPHKNLPAAVTAFAHAELGETEFVVPARDSEAELALRPLIRGAGVRLVREIRDEEMPLLYAAARVVLCPSLAEGFGFAPLEAAGSGTAVVASDIPPHREVMEDGACYIPAPHDAPAIADALLRVWNDASARQGLVTRGRARAAGFTWRRTAELTLEVYRGAARRSPRSVDSLL